MEFDILAGVNAATGAGAVSAFGWLCSKLWRMIRHEVDDMKHATTSNTSALISAMDDFKQHMRRDEEVQLGIVSELKEMKGYLKGREHDHALG